MMQFRLIAMVPNQDLKECYCAYIEKSIKILSQHSRTTYQNTRPKNMKGILILDV